MFWQDANNNNLMFRVVVVSYDNYFFYVIDYDWKIISKL